MAIRVEEYVLKANEFINQVAKQLGDPADTDHASRVTLSVLHTLRDVLTPEESVHLLAQLPLYVKAAYVDGWKIKEQGQKTASMDSFLECLREQNNFLAGKDFKNDDEGRKNVQAVLTVLKKYISQGEIQHVLGRLPLGIVQAEIQSQLNT